MNWVMGSKEGRGGEYGEGRERIKRGEKSEEEGLKGYMGEHIWDDYGRGGAREVMGRWER